MRQCPKCRKWTVDFDEYFGRFRCLNPQCAWMPPSTAEREIRLLQSHREPTKLDSVEMPELGLTLTPCYDPENDALSVDFGLDEPTFDLPEPDGRMIWRIGRRSDAVTGFSILGVREGSISEVSVQFIARRKEDIERALRRVPAMLARGRASRELIERIVVTAVSDENQVPSTSPEVEGRWRQVVRKIEGLTAP